MKQRVLVVVLATVFYACAEKPLAQSARLLGVNQLALVGNYIFSTSTDNNELRVLDLAPSAVQGRQFLPAPNPLEPLSIPVVSRPVNLVRDTRYDPNTYTVPAGIEGVVNTIDVTFPDGRVVTKVEGDTFEIPGGVDVSGPYVYATAAGGVEISVVDGRNDDANAAVGDRHNLRELKRLIAPAPVTAMTAFRISDTESRIAYSTWDGSRALLVVVSLPPPDALPSLTAAEVAQRTQVLDSLPGEAVSALLYLSPDRLVVATRKDRGATGRTYVFNPVTLASLPLEFPGPVRQLITHQGLIAENRVHPSGERVFGVLDEEACGNPGCGGIVAVDSATGKRSLDSSGQPMITLTAGDALIEGLVVGPTMLLSLPAADASGTAAAVPQSLLGVATASTGTLVFFDALALSQIDFNPLAPHATLAGLEYPPTDSNPNTTVQVYAPGPVIDDPLTADVDENSIALTAGLARTETVAFVNLGEIPDLIGLPTTAADGLRFPITNGTALRVLVGDWVEIAGADGACGEEQVTQVDADAVRVARLGVACPGRSAFSVRAGASPSPYVVSGTASGYMGRTGPDRDFTYQGSAFFHPRTFDPAVPQMQLHLGPGLPDLPRGARWVLDIDDGYRPYVATVDSQVGCSPSLPGAPVLDFARQKLFVAYPSANGIMEIDPSVAYRGALSRNVYCYR